ncbi:MAG: selenocysteine-specific translation elongation factor [Thermodesulfobacteriota bacterium]
MKQVILGTAGHIDHGKTSLIKSITGIDTDRLKEEKERGITIELGFAHLDLPSGDHLGIVDVPGHEKFVKNMVAGATGIDMVAMVIAADEGIMPQTTEHMEICSLLGIRQGVVVLTKTDLVDSDWLDLVKEEIREFSRGTFLENAPIVPVSSATGEGLPELIKTLGELSAKMEIRPPSTLLRIPIDRVFSMKGFGTVITGTLISGKVNVGEPIMIYPTGIASKVRGIQVHNQFVEKAEAGMRTAINIQGVEKTVINRGDVIARPETLKPTYMLDVMFQYLGSNTKPVKNRTRIRFHAGTSEILGNLVLLETDQLLPGESAFAQIRLDTPIVAVKEDRFVIRSYSPVRTIGGGHVLNPIPPKHKRFRTDIVQGLTHIAKDTPEEVVLFHIRQSGYGGISFSDLLIMTNVREKNLETILAGFLSKKHVLLFDRENRTYIHFMALTMLKEEVTRYLNEYHTLFPLKTGMSKEELRSRFPQTLEVKVFNLAISQMLLEKTIFQEEQTIRTASHIVSLGRDQTDLKQMILDTYRKSALSPPYFKELVKEMNLDLKQGSDVLMVLVDEGELIKVKEDLFFYSGAVNDFKKRLVGFIESHGQIGTPELKEMAGVSRKYVIPLIEYFDSKNITIRVGDVRKLRTRINT